MIVLSPQFVAGVRAERKARGEWLARVQTWHEGKSDVWLEGYESAVVRVIELLEADAVDWSPNCSLPIDGEHCQSCFEYAKLMTRIKGEN